MGEAEARALLFEGRALGFQEARGLWGCWGVAAAVLWAGEEAGEGEGLFEAFTVAVWAVAWVAVGSLARMEATRLRAVCEGGGDGGRVSSWVEALWGAAAEGFCCCSTGGAGGCCDGLGARVDAGAAMKAGVAEGLGVGVSVGSWGSWGRSSSKSSARSGRPRRRSQPLRSCVLKAWSLLGTDAEAWMLGEAGFCFSLAVDWALLGCA